MSAAHTPGPWVYCHNDSEYYEHRIRAKPGCICIMPGWRIHEDLRLEQEANAHLICAAPELLAALQSILLAVNVRIDDPRIGLFDIARAAVAKATGGAA
jgi:hypothetical protein